MELLDASLVLPRGVPVGGRVVCPRVRRGGGGGAGPGRRAQTPGEEEEVCRLNNTSCCSPPRALKALSCFKFSTR